MSQLYNSIYHIRKLIEEIKFNIVIENRERYYVLHLNDIKLDIDEWENSIQKIPSLSKQTIPLYLQVIYDYRGDLFQNQGYLWSERRSTKLRKMWLYCVEKVSSFLLEKRKYLQVLNIYHHVQKVYPLGTESYKTLMKLYAYLNKHDVVIAQYTALESMLQPELDLQPDQDVQAWFNEWYNSIKSKQRQRYAHGS